MKLRERPVCQPLPDQLDEVFDAPIPFDPEGIEQSYAELKAHLMASASTETSELVYTVKLNTLEKWCVMLQILRNCSHN